MKKILSLSLCMLCIGAQANGRVRARKNALDKKKADLKVAYLPLLANVIAGNLGDGVYITNNSSGNVISGNVIGSDLSGNLDLGNGGAGVHIDINSSNNLVGGSNLTAGNIIANNYKGVIVGDSAADLSVGNSILTNSIYNNEIIGIDLANDGPTPNHATSPTEGPNDFQNYPVITSAKPNSSGLLLSGTLNSVPSSNFTLQFFSNNVGDPEGKLFLTEISVNTNSGGRATFSVQIPGVPLNSPITSTATRIVDGDPTDTSEFGVFFYGVAQPCLPSCKK